MRACRFGIPVDYGAAYGDFDFGHDGDMPSIGPDRMAQNVVPHDLRNLRRGEIDRVETVQIVRRNLVGKICAEERDVFRNPDIVFPHIEQNPVCIDPPGSPDGVGTLGSSERIPAVVEIDEFDTGSRYIVAEPSFEDPASGNGFASMRALFHRDPDCAVSAFRQIFCRGTSEFALIDEDGNIASASENVDDPQIRIFFSEPVFEPVRDAADADDDIRELSGLQDFCRISFNIEQQTIEIRREMIDQFCCAEREIWNQQIAENQHGGILDGKEIDSSVFGKDVEYAFASFSADVRFLIEHSVECFETDASLICQCLIICFFHFRTPFLSVISVC